MKIFNALIFIIISVVCPYPCFSLNDLDSNKILLDSIIIKVNTICKNKFDTTVFNTQRVNFYENEHGKLFYKAVPISKNDSGGIISFYAIKAPDWQDWKIRLKTSFRKKTTQREKDSLQDWMINNIDNIISGGCCMSEEHLRMLKRMSDKDSMITDEIEYWDIKK